jgi:hypothetical protein
MVAIVKPDASKQVFHVVRKVLFDIDNSFPCSLPNELPINAAAKIGQRVNVARQGALEGAQQSIVPSPFCGNKD